MHRLGPKPEREHAGAMRPVPEIEHGLHQEPVARQLDQCAMKALVRLGPCVQIVGLERTCHVARCPLQRLDLGLGRPAPGRQLRRHGLQCRQDLVDFLHVVGRHGHHAHAMTRHDLDQPLVAQPQQRFAQRRAADAQLLGELQLECPVTWRIDVVQDALTDGPIRLVDQRCAPVGGQADTPPGRGLGDALWRNVAGGRHPASALHAPALARCAAAMLRKTRFSTASPIRITLNRPANTLAISSWFLFS